MTKRERARLIKLLEKISDAFEEYTDNLEDDGDFWEALGKAEDFVKEGEKDNVNVHA